MYIASQVCAFIAIALIVYSSAVKVSRKALLVYNILVNVYNAAHYLLLQAYSGAVCCVIFAIMLFVFYFKGKTKFLSSIMLPVVFGVAFVVFGLATYQNWISIIPIVGHLLLVIAFWMDEEIVIKRFCVVVALMWVVYNGLLWSVVNFCGQVVCFISYTTYVVRWHRRERRAKAQCSEDLSE